MIFTHDLHAVVGDILRSLAIDGSEILLDKACGGTESIRLYGELDDSRQRDPCLCWVDAAILFNGSLQVIVEIEQSDIRPLYFCGKLLATALSRYYKGKRGRFALSDSLLFIQIFERKDDNENWSKYNQCRYLMQEFNRCLLHPRTRIKEYVFHYGTVEDFGVAEHREALANEVAQYLTKSLAEKA